MSTQTSHSLRLTRVVQADRERVFRAWTDPAVLKEWFCPEGFTVAEISADATVGGRYRVTMRAPEGQTHTASGVYRKVDRPSRLVFTWAWEGGDMIEDDTLLTVELKDMAGATEVVLIHEGFPTAESKENHTKGWSSCLDQLERRMSA